MSTSHAVFARARPVWPSGLADEMNVTIGFRADVDCSGPCTLRLAAASVYRLWVDGAFVGYGPARAPHGHARIDAWELGPGGRHAVAIEVVSCNVNSYYIPMGAPFLQAEVVDTEGTVLAATEPDSATFSARRLEERIQKVQRYSYQRGFSEAYHLAPGFDQWRTATASADALPLEPAQEATLLPRRLPYPHFDIRRPAAMIARGTVSEHAPEGDLWRDRALTGIGDRYLGFPEDTLGTTPALDIQRLRSDLTPVETTRDDVTPLALAEHECGIVDLGRNQTGFVGVDITCERGAVLWLVFDEMLTAGDVDIRRLGCVSIVELHLEPGTYRFESCEPYTMRYLKLVALKGACSIADVYLREYAHPCGAAARLETSDRRLSGIFDAAVSTFRQNAVDTFMDCPSRERAGWLCDSFWTARTAWCLSGDLNDETAFLENFLLPDHFECLPEGMLPMCYPADSWGDVFGTFIPQWSLWFVVQLGEYAARGGDEELVKMARSRIDNLFAYFEGFVNSDGLLEGLEGWRFIEWSRANEFVDGVNYPTNMLFAAALEAAGRIYGRTEWCERADAIHATVLEQAFDGTFFVDQALRTDGELKPTGHHTEVCQYYAFFFGTATPDSHPDLWHLLVDHFGIQRRGTDAYPDVPPANALVGNFMRLELLSLYGEHERLARELAEYFTPMVELTGTLWENDNPTASCNHGFASYAAVWLLRDLLGLHRDPEDHSLYLEPVPCGLDSMSATLPTGSGTIRASWRADGDTVDASLDIGPATRQ